MPNKTKIIGPVDVPEQYFRDFLRGHFDGDGSTYSYFDPRWPKSFLIYSSFISASGSHIAWLRHEISSHINTNGRVSFSNGVYRLRFAKRETIKIFNFIYYQPNLPCWRRKWRKFYKAIQLSSLVRQ